MDFMAILKTALQGFSMSNIWTIGLTAVATIVAYKIFDEIVLWALMKYWPEKYLSIFYGWVEQLNNNIEDLKKKFPKTGKALEDRILSVLDRIEAIIVK